MSLNQKEPDEDADRQCEECGDYYEWAELTYCTGCQKELCDHCYNGCSHDCEDK